MPNSKVAKENGRALAAITGPVPLTCADERCGDGACDEGCGFFDEDC